MDKGIELEVILLRTKLEIRTWFLRISLAFNIGLISFLLVRNFG